ncbi:MAG: tetratricopeptide repeat protein [Clostridia bacterium]|nr:tetratricopeptide repeat protein [Clostridia bacterium]
MIPKDRVLARLDLLLRENDYPGAKRLLEYWLSEAESMGDDRGALLMENELMGLCRKLSEEEKALYYAQAALDRVGRMGIGDAVGGATTFLNSATVCKAFGRAEDALHLFQMAREVYERELSSTDERLAGLYNNLGLALVDLERFREAEALYEKALALLSALPDKEPEQAITYLNLATLAETEQGIDGGREAISALCEKARACLEKGRERQDGNYAFVCEKCATVFGFYGLEDYAAELLSRCRRIYEGT